jgi:hypothetical protein
VRCFDSSMEVVEPYRFGHTRHLRIRFFYTLLEPDQVFERVLEPAGDRRCV